MFADEYNFLNAQLDLLGWATDKTKVQDIMTIVVNGTPFTVSGSYYDAGTIDALIDTINKSSVGNHITASAEQDERTKLFYLAITANNPSVQTLSVLNDHTMIMYAPYFPFANPVLASSNDEYSNEELVCCIVAGKQIGRAHV